MTDQSKRTQIAASRPPAPIATGKAIDLKASMEIVGLTKTPFYEAVASGRLPSPFYPAPRAPRWYEDELRAAMELTRAKPRDQLVARRKAALKKASSNERVPDTISGAAA